jgi:hypothetical protein
MEFRARARRASSGPNATEEGGMSVCVCRVCGCVQRKAVRRGEARCCLGVSRGNKSRAQGEGEGQGVMTEEVMGDGG